MGYTQSVSKPVRTSLRCEFRNFVFERQRAPVCWFTPRLLGARPRLKVGAGNTIPVSHLGGKNPIPRAITAPSLRCSPEPGGGSRTQALQCGRGHRTRRLNHWTQRPILNCSLMVGFQFGTQTL